MKCELDDLPINQPATVVCNLCREEIARFRRGEVVGDLASFEVFRRAIVENDQFCWAALLDIYGDQVHAWCRRAGGEQAGSLDELVALTWEKFWRHYTGEKLAAAAGTREVLAYLKMCARSVVVDALRRQEDAGSIDVLSIADPWGAPDFDECIERAAREELWRMIDALLRDDRERVVIMLRYRDGLRASDVQTLYPALFPSVTDVYRVNRNVLERLRRSRVLHQWTLG